MSFDVHIQIIEGSDLGRGFTGADWFWDEQGNLQVRVSRLNDWRKEFSLAIHEAVEAALCKHNGVSQEAVDVFDREYEKIHWTDLDAGDDPDAPYRREHCFASACERMLIAEFGVSWKEYDDDLEAVGRPKESV